MRGYCAGSFGGRGGGGTLRNEYVVDVNSGRESLRLAFSVRRSISRHGFATPTSVSVWSLSGP